MKKVFNFEVYLKSPVSGQSGWELHFVNVYANNETEARQQLKFYPRFDKVLQYNGEVTPTKTDINGWEGGNLFRRVPLTEVKQPSFI